MSSFSLSFTFHCLQGPHYSLSIHPSRRTFDMEDGVDTVEDNFLPVCGHCVQQPYPSDKELLAVGIQKCLN